MIEYAPDPAHRTFEVLLLLLAALFVVCWRYLPRDGQCVSKDAGPRTARLSPDIRAVVLRAAPAVMSAFAVGTVMLSLGAQIARDLVRSQNMLVNGAVIGSFAIVCGVTSVLFKRLRSQAAIRAGGSATGAAMLLLALAARVHSLPLLIVSVFGAGIGYALLFMGGLALVSEGIDHQHRGLSLSTLYSTGYAMQAITALALGITASHIGLRNAVTYGAIAIAAACVLTAASTGTLDTSRSGRDGQAV